MKLPFELSRLNLSILIISAFSLIAIVAGTVFFVNRTTKEHLTIAAGAPTGDSYVISQALKTVVERHYPDIKITVLQTGGTSENLKLLEEKKVELAAAQADVPAGDSALSIAVLFRDSFQLGVHKDSEIRSFADLRGKRIAIPQTGGQFRSFLAVASHFGLMKSDFQFVGRDDASADLAFGGNEADAIFRVRALNNNAILKFAKSGNVEFLAIDQAAAMQIRIPAYMPSVIPRGAYSGSPAIPPQDLPTISVERTLLTRGDVSEVAIRAITTVLVEFRHEVALAIPDPLAEIRPLLAGVQQPNTQSGLGIAIHPGAKAYYDKDVPSFFQQYADYVGLWVTVALLFGSWIWEGKRWLENRQKNLADKYNHDVIGLIDRANAANSSLELEATRVELLAVLMKAVRDLDNGKVTHEGFHSFRTIWQIAIDAVRERYLCIPEPPPARTPREDADFAAA
jgi:TRAP transporter TAXI family solute receptor